VRTALCELLDIEHPIVGFTPSEHVAAAISRAGGLGVLGCVRFNDAEELDAVLDWMDANTGGRPYGVDVVMPARVPTEGTPVDLDRLIPPEHKDFVEQTLIKLGVPPLPDGSPGRDGVLGWLHSVARQHVEVALAHPARLIANALGPPPPDVISRAHERGMRVPAVTWPAAWTSSWPRATRRAATPARSRAWCWCRRSSTRSARRCRCSRRAGSVAAARSPPRSR
jgi:NAD(P)H-dependent flavin oxidoreductase YrpB (nitropropane dioxygenase family)